MSLDLGQAMRDTVREVVREEIRAAMKEFTGASLGADAPLDYKQAAEFIGCHVHTLASWKKRGILPFSGKGKMTRFKRADLLLALEKQSAPDAAAKTTDSVVEKILAKGNVRKIR